MQPLHIQRVLVGPKQCTSLPEAYNYVVCKTHDARGHENDMRT